jgi:hypothetical protein
MAARHTGTIGPRLMHCLHAETRRRVSLLRNERESCPAWCPAQQFAPFPIQDPSEVRFRLRRQALELVPAGPSRPVPNRAAQVLSLQRKQKVPTADQLSLIVPRVSSAQNTAVIRFDSALSQIEPEKFPECCRWLFVQFHFRHAPNSFAIFNPSRRESNVTSRYPCKRFAIHGGHSSFGRDSTARGCRDERCR